MKGKINQSFGNDTELIQILNLADMGIKIFIKTAFHIFKNLSKNMGNIKTDQMKH